MENGKEGTDFDGGDAKATGLEDDADAAGRDALAEATDHAAGDEHVLHSPIDLNRTVFVKMS